MNYLTKEEIERLEIVTGEDLSKYADIFLTVDTDKIPLIGMQELISLLPTYVDSIPLCGEGYRKNSKRKEYFELSIDFGRGYVSYRRTGYEGSIEEELPHNSFKNGVIDVNEGGIRFNDFLNDENTYEYDEYDDILHALYKLVIWVYNTCNSEKEMIN